MPTFRFSYTATGMGHHPACTPSGPSPPPGHSTLRWQSAQPSTSGPSRFPPPCHQHCPSAACPHPPRAPVRVRCEQTAGAGASAASYLRYACSWEHLLGGRGYLGGTSVSRCVSRRNSMFDLRRMLSVVSMGHCARHFWLICASCSEAEWNLPSRLGRPL